LNELDRRYLQTIIAFYDGGPVGIEALAATVNEEKDTLVDVIEPYLLKKDGSSEPLVDARSVPSTTRPHLDRRPYLIK
jgi:Holliday junction resolvasome RuvABC ATP-dependent DNA helicase subunit